MIDQLPLLTVLLLCLVALAAGWIDSVVGGGGVIQLPALFIGLPSSTPVATVSGTNKLSSVVGTAMASATYVSKIKIHWPTALAVVVTAYGGSTLGATLVRFIPRTAFSPIIVVIVAVVGVYTWRRPKLGETTSLRHHGVSHWLIALAIGAVIGVYDGMVGPGTGVFLTIAFVALLGYGFLEATTMAKLANLTTNIAALVVFGFSGQILWLLGGCMAVCNLTGAAIGSRMAIKHGNRFIRSVFLIALIIVEAKLIYDMIMLYI